MQIFGLPIEVVLMAIFGCAVYLATMLHLAHSKPNTQIPCPNCHTPLEIKMETETFEDIVAVTNLEYACPNENCPLAKNLVKPTSTVA